MKNTSYSGYNSLVIKLTLLCDLMICILLYLAFINFKGLQLTEGIMQSSLIIGLTYLICLIQGGVVLHKITTRDFSVLLVVMRNITLFALSSTILLYIGSFFMLPLGTAILFYIITGLCSILFRLTLRNIIKRLRKHHKFVRHVVLVGCSGSNIELYKEMTHSPERGFWVKGYFDFRKDPYAPDGCEYLGTPDKVMEYIENNPNVDELYCSLTYADKELIAQIAKHSQKSFVKFFSVPNVPNVLNQKMHYNSLGNVPYLSIFRDPLSSPINRFIKRAFDIIFSTLFLVFIFPFVFIAVAIVTKITMPGPIFFRQKRTGLNGKDFDCIKFRSMKVNKDADTLQATKGDPRVTKWGEIMRKTNIDELPQFINVFLGDMSIVGPRPHMLKHTDAYSKLIDKYMLRHFIKPGVTGWSQVTGFRGETKELSQMEGRIKGDIWYMEHWSIWLDLYIIIKTVTNTISGDKAAY